MLERHFYVVLRFGPFVGSASVPYAGSDCAPWPPGVRSRDTALSALEDFLSAAGPEALRWDGVPRPWDSPELDEALDLHDWETVAVLDSSRWPETVATLELMEELDATLN